jgi:hypothetical protein
MHQVMGVDALGTSSRWLTGTTRWRRTPIHLLTVVPPSRTNPCSHVLFKLHSIYTFVANEIGEQIVGGCRLAHVGVSFPALSISDVSAFEQPCHALQVLTSKV